MLRHRAFCIDFVDYMAENGGWPDHKLAMAHLDARKQPKKRDELSRIRQGHSVPVHYARNFVQLLLDDPGDAFTMQRRVLLEFLAERGFRDPASADIQVVLSQVCDAPTPGPTRRDPSWRDWIRHARELLTVHYVAGRYRRAAAMPADGFPFDRAAEFAFTRLGQDRSPEGRVSSRDETIQVAEGILGISVHEYAERLAEYSAASPWSVVVARDRSRPLGVSVCLPVTADAYAAIRSGTVSPLDVDRSMIATPANELVFQVLAENPELASSQDEPSKSMLVAVAAQYAALLRCGQGPPERPASFRVIAPEGTSRNRERMASGRFRGLDVHEPQAGVRLWERRFVLGDGIAQDLAEEERQILLRIGVGAADAPVPFD